MTQGILPVARPEHVSRVTIQDSEVMMRQFCNKIKNGEFVPFSCDRCGAVHYGLWTAPMRCTCGNIKRADRLP